MKKKKYTSDLFISYATEDLESGVSELFMAIYETGITSSWLDRIMIKPGDSIPEKIDEGLNSTRYLLPVITETYFNKTWTRAELDAVRILSKPTIPIWINVTSKQVGKFSAILAAQKAIVYKSNPYEVAEQVGEVLLTNKRTHFYKNRASRAESKLFWQCCYLQVLHIIEGKNIDDLWIGQLAEPDRTGATMRGNIDDALNLSDDEILTRTKFYRARADELGNEISDEDISQLICGEAKRKLAWFPHEPGEHLALKKIGLDRF
ncbi:MAG: toll/interleukin-1 receptor domain-containing protein [Cyclobacteriaceae bacterium]